jgi:hypothetical protein
MGIFVSGFHFNGPIPIPKEIPQLDQGLFAIFIPEDPRNPNRYRVVYIGDSKEISKIGSFTSFYGYEMLLAISRSQSNLYIGLCVMWQYTPEEIKSILSILYEHYPIRRLINN